MLAQHIKLMANILFSARSRRDCGKARTLLTLICDECCVVVVVILLVDCGFVAWCAMQK